MTNSKIFLYSCLSFVAGIFLSLNFYVSQFLMLGFLIFSLIMIYVFWKYKKIVISGFCLLFLLLGIWRCELHELSVKDSELKNYINEEISFVGVINNQPVQKEQNSKLEVELPEFKEKILVTVFKYPEYEYGDRVRVAGKLEEPPIFDSFDYKEYLARNNIYGLMFLPEIELLKKGAGNEVLSILFSIKNILKNSLGRIMPLPESALMEGLLFGDEDGFSEEWLNKFNMTGTRHVTAVSGMNITILSALVLDFLLLLGFWRHQAFYLSIAIIIFYVLMIGAPASGIRAAVMGVIFLTAQHFGRASDATRAVIFSAGLMLFFNPFLLTDIGFQLSFLAVMGLIYLQPFFMKLLRKVPQALELRYSLAATLSAQAFTFPVLIYNFGYVSVIAPVVNVLIVPLLPAVTIFGFLVSVVGIFLRSLALILSFPVYLVLSYILKIIDFSFQIPYLNLAFENVSWIFVLLSYLLLGFLVGKLQKKRGINL